ncbi:hypothetical protein OL548_16380 [Lysinibacillus sp. MHQ-1]|nr:hypothetical protein OL548_16380 [Lysinibacillus sp. MHQ-1]
MEKLISPVPGKVNPQIVGKSASCLADSVGITVPDETKVLVGLETMIGKKYSVFSGKVITYFLLSILSKTVQKLSK